MDQCFCVLNITFIIVPTVAYVKTLHFWQNIRKIATCLILYLYSPPLTLCYTKVDVCYKFSYDMHRQSKIGHFINW